MYWGVGWGGLCMGFEVFFGCEVKWGKCGGGGEDEGCGRSWFDVWWGIRVLI